MKTPKVERATLPLRSLVPAGYNPRKIDARARKGLKASIDRFGVVQDIVVNRLPDGTYRIVGGHQRVDVLLSEKATEAPCAIVELGEVDERALNVALNNPHIAGEQIGRRVYAVELAPEYVDVAVNRWQAFTGKLATLDGDGRTFDEIKAERMSEVA